MPRPVPHSLRFLLIRRETAALALAACAVACLSSAIIHWSSRSPIDETVAEHPLFDNRVSEEISAAVNSAPDIEFVEESPDRSAPLASRPLFSRESRQNLRDGDVDAHSHVIPVGFTEPSERDSRSTGVVVQKQRNTRPVWLSGGIEDVVEGGAESTVDRSPPIMFSRVPRNE